MRSRFKQSILTMKVKQRIKRILKPVLNPLDYILDYRYDFLRYRIHSIKNGITKTDRQLKFRLLQRAHSFEKGLSLSHVRPLFGEEKLRELVQLIKRYEGRGLSKDSVEYQMAINAFHSYVCFHEKHAIDIFKKFDFLSELTAENTNIIGDSTITVKSDYILDKAKGDFEQLSKSRFSTRQFSTQPVEKEVIKEAIALAQKTPSVCNRQSGHVFLIDNKDLSAKALSIQAGNAGFGHEVNKLLVVTASLDCFDGPKERNQGYVDGGLFAMSLMYALHYKGLAVCPLNWSSGRKKDRKLRSVLSIPNEHVVIMLLAVGQYKEEFNVAASPRRAFSDVYTEIR